MKKKDLKRIKNNDRVIDKCIYGDFREFTDDKLCTIDENISLSIQAGFGWYSSPREYMDSLYDYTNVELGILVDGTLFNPWTNKIPVLYKYREYTEEYGADVECQVFPYIPVEIVQDMYVDLMKVYSDKKYFKSRYVYMMEFREPKLLDKKPTYSDPPRIAMNTTQKYHVIPDTLATFNDLKLHIDYHQNEGASMLKDLSPCVLLEDIPLKNDTFTPQYNEAISIDTYTYNHFHDEETAKSITEEGKKRMQECLKDLNL